jgi:hypothetical protein
MVELMPAGEAAEEDRQLSGTGEHFPSKAAAPAGRMEITLGGHRISIFADVDANALARVIRALERR